MPFSTLIKTITISNAVSEDFKFEIYQNEKALFHADISRKDPLGKWEQFRNKFRFSKALDVEEVIGRCRKLVDDQFLAMKE
jgi:hypothetical protein